MQAQESKAAAPAPLPASSASTPPAPLAASVSASGVADFKCNICLNIASDAVVTLCGHLFCWPCLYTWLHYHSRYKECPVCKGAASETRLIPIYSWGTAKDAGNSSKAPHSHNHIPPRPPAKRTESERQRRQRYLDTERGRRMDQHPSDSNNATMNQVLFGLNESASLTDAHNVNNAAATNGGNSGNNTTANTNSNANQHLIGRETRASWLERLRAMREERLAWPVAFVHGLTSRELLQQRRQARELTLSPRLMNMGQDCSMIDPNIDIAASYCQSGHSQPGALQRALSLACMDRNPRPLVHKQQLPTSSTGVSNASHASQYLSTMSSILSSMEVFAKALELSSASSLPKHSLTSSGHTPTMQQHLGVFNIPNEEQDLWQSSMHGLLAQMERLMVQLQAIQPIMSSTPLTNHHMLQNHWINNASVAIPTNATQPNHHHHHHHYHIDGNLIDRAHMVNPLMERGLFGEGDVRTNAMNANHILGLSPRMGARSSDPNANMGHLRSLFPFSLHGSGGAGGELQHPNTSKSRKRWDVTRMST